MIQAKYKALKQETAVADDPEDVKKGSIVHLTAQKCSYSTWLIGLMLVVSLLANVLHYIPLPSWTGKRQYNKTYASYLNNIPTVFVHDNRSVDDEMWTSDRFNMDDGVVALDDKYVRERGLLPASRYPWDLSKSVYLLQGYHAMHCVLVFRDLIMDVRDKKSSFWPHKHMVHCLHTLREEIECYADNFPLYISIPDDPEEEDKITPGVGETRMCRSWDDLRDFALANTACWSKHGWHKDDPIVDAFKRCSDGSKPWEDLELEQRSQ